MTQMSWSKLLDSNRLGNRPIKNEAGRSPFNSDHDKIVFSGAFRRLAKKTQVHPLATNDHIHNRLTHSLEVACVGRSLGVRVGESLAKNLQIPEGVTPVDLGDIVQSACLAHDIGNPPFGHVGEEAIKYWFRSEKAQPYLEKLSEDEKKELENFEGNAQGFRVLTTSEYHAYDGGMRLTHATLAAFTKYPWGYDKGLKKEKYGVHISEADFFEEIAESVGLIRKGELHFCRHPLAHLMELSDDFCYGLLDLEDGIEMGILQWDEVYSIFESVLDQSKKSELEKELKNLRPGRRPSLIRGKIISAFVEDASSTFINNQEKILNGSIDSLIEHCSNDVHNCVKNAKKLAFEKVFNHPRKVELEIGAYSVVSTLLNVIIRAVDSSFNKEHSNNKDKNELKIDAQCQQVLKLIGPTTFDPSTNGTDNYQNISKYQAIRRAVDFVSGMTDNYATYLSKQFNGMGEVR